MIDNRARILDAAARVYAEYGYRGATTRRIAFAAGVNEVTLFRTFGSKAALIDAAVRSRAASAAARAADRATLPSMPVDPERELTAWATAFLGHLRDTRALLRKSMGDLEERPDIAPCAAAEIPAAADQLRHYVCRLIELQFVEEQEEAHAAGTMLIAALFSDAMGREMMPGLHPEPADEAPALYVRSFLRAVRCAKAPRRRARVTSSQARS